MSASVTVATLGMGALNALEVFFLRDNLRVTPAWLGTCWAVVGAGAIAGALLGGRTSSRIGPARDFRVSMITGGLLLLAHAGLTRIGPALAILTAVGCAFGALNAAATPIFLTLIPPDMTGRVMSVFTPPAAGSQHHLDRPRRTPGRRPA